jgi:signal transduction histidine kinase
MRIGQRLLLAVIPGIIGVFAVAGLAYWGEYGRQAPEALVAVAAIATVVSLVVAWRNTRYVAQRIERLAAASDADELESIEQQLREQKLALETMERRLADEESAAVVRARAHGALLRAVAGQLRNDLDEIRLPLHILLDNHFGDLNENQEEMLGAARSAAERAELALRQTETVIGSADGSLDFRADRVRAGDLVSGALPPLRAIAERREIVLTEDVAPALGALHTDRAKLQEAIQALMGGVLESTPGGSTAVFSAASADGRFVLRLRCSGELPPALPMALGRALIEGAGGTATVRPGLVEISLPTESAPISTLPTSP